MKRDSTDIKRIKAITKLIKSEMKAQGITAYRLAADTGISYSSIHNMVGNESWGQQIDTLIKVLDVLGYDFALTKRPVTEQPE